MFLEKFENLQSHTSIDQRGTSRALGCLVLVSELLLTAADRKQNSQGILKSAKLRQLQTTRLWS
jgi:hypothetical protein